MWTSRAAEAALGSQPSKQIRLDVPTGAASLPRHAGGTAGTNNDTRAWRRRLPADPGGEARPR
jgi:hypothetical protein